jgi:hypothetical protein
MSLQEKEKKGVRLAGEVTGTSEQVATHEACYMLEMSDERPVCRMDEQGVFGPSRSLRPGPVATLGVLSGCSLGGGTPARASHRCTSVDTRPPLC